MDPGHKPIIEFWVWILIIHIHNLSISSICWWSEHHHLDACCKRMCFLGDCINCYGFGCKIRKRITVVNQIVLGLDENYGVMARSSSVHHHDGPIMNPWSEFFFFFFIYLFIFKNFNKRKNEWPLLPITVLQKWWASSTSYMNTTWRTWVRQPKKTWRNLELVEDLNLVMLHSCPYTSTS